MILVVVVRDASSHGGDVSDDKFLVRGSRENEKQEEMSVKKETSKKERRIQEKETATKCNIGKIE